MASRLALHSALASSSQPVTVRVQRSRRAEQQSTLEQRAVEFLAFEETLEDLDQIALQMARDETIVAPETVIGEKNRRRATRNRDRYMRDQQEQSSDDPQSQSLSYEEQLEAAAKLNTGGSECMRCSSCKGRIDFNSEASVAMETLPPRATMLGPAPGGVVEWTDDGQAVLHRTCFDAIKSAPDKMSLAARKRFSAGVSGAEFYDSMEDVRAAAMQVHTLALQPIRG